MIVASFTSSLGGLYRLLDTNPLDEYRADLSAAMKSSSDGSQSQVLQRSTLALARSIVAQYGATAPLADVSPQPDGSLSLTWRDNNGNKIYLGVGPNNTLHLYYRSRQGDKWEGVSGADDQQLGKQIAYAFESMFPTQVVYRYAIEQYTSDTPYLAALGIIAGLRPRPLAAAHS